MSVGPQLREANAGDMSALLALERGCDGAPHWSEAAWRGMLTGGERTVIVAELLLAELPMQLIGFAVVELVLDTASLESICVRLDARGHGVGRALGVAALQWARGRGAAAMELEVRASNTAALGLYRRLGFVEQGRRPRYYASPVEDAVLMGVDLG